MTVITKALLSKNINDGGVKTEFRILLYVCSLDAVAAIAMRQLTPTPITL